LKYGIRAIRPRRSLAHLKMSENLDVCATGGSDCHGLGRDGMLLGKIKLPYERVEALKALVPAKT
jgi:hypothetical protein